jgi:hypothetical protein
MDDNNALPIIEPRLRPGERLIWYGTPDPWRAALPYFALLPFCLICILILGVTAVKAPAPPTIIMLLLMGGVVGGVAGCFYALVSIIGCWNTVYALTDSRLIIAVGKGGWRSSTSSYGAEDINPLTWGGDEDWGTVFFGEMLAEGGWVPKHAFYGIHHPARVMDLITETLLNKNPGPKR